MRRPEKIAASNLLRQLHLFCKGIDRRLEEVQRKTGEPGELVEEVFIDNGRIRKGPLAK